MHPRPLIVAQGPPSPAHETRRALEGTQVGTRIARLAGLPDADELLALVDTTYLVPTYVDVLLPQLGRHYATRLLERLWDEERTTVVLLGLPVASALGVGHVGLHVPVWRPKVWETPGGARGPCWWVTPLPAGLERWWSDDLNRARARRFWRWLAGVAAQVDRPSTVVSPAVAIGSGSVSASGGHRESDLASEPWGSGKSWPASWGWSA